MKKILILLIIISSCTNVKQQSKVTLTVKKNILRQTDSLTEIINDFIIDSLPKGEKNILSLVNPMTIGEINKKYKDTIYSINRGYDYPKYYKVNPYINSNNFKKKYGISYYDIEANSLQITICDTLTRVINRLPNKFSYKIILSQLNLILSPKKQGNDILNIYTFDNNKITDGLNIYYSISLSMPKYERNLYKKQYSGFIQKFFYIDNNYIISLFYIDDLSQGEGETYEFIRKEQWQIKPNGKFARYYEKDGVFKNHEEEGVVKNSMREGKWIETKPNAYVNQKTYLEAEFNEGEKIREWKYYAYEGLKKGKLLYTETYKKGELIERVFVK